MTMIRLMLLLLMFSFSQMSSGFSYTVELTERSLQEKVELIMPLEKKQYFFTVRLSEPKVALINKSNEVGMFMHVDVIAPGGFKGGGRGQIAGSVRYEQKTGEFFLDAPRLVGLEIDLLPKRLMPKISKLAEILLTKASSKLPVYRLRDDDAKHQLAKSTLKSIKVKDHKLLITLGMF
jgi:Protein of unknown function (DUF1439)